MSEPASNIVDFLRERGEGRLVDEIIGYEAGIDNEFGDLCDKETIARGECGYTDINEVAALRIMAESYTTHPQYNPAWKVDW
jgi:hypothetical protein